MVGWRHLPDLQVERPDAVRCVSLLFPAPDLPLQPPPLLELRLLCSPASSCLADLSQAQISPLPLLPEAQGCSSSRNLGVCPRGPVTPSSPHLVCQHTPALYCTKNSQSLPCCFPSFLSYFSTLCSQSDLVKACESRCHSSAQPQAPTTTGASVVLMVKVAGPCLQPDATAPGPRPTSQPTTFQSLRQATFFPTSEPQTCSALPSA